MNVPAEPIGLRDAPGAVHGGRPWNPAGVGKFLAAAAWLIGFLIFFYTFDLPNNQYNRRAIWLEVPELLAANLVSAEEVPGAAPVSGWRYFPQRLDLLLTAGLILAGAWGLGSLLLRVMWVGVGGRNEIFSTLETTFFAFALGLSGLSLVTLGCGLAGFLSRPWFVAALVGCLVIAMIAETVQRFRGRGDRLNEADRAIDDVSATAAGSHRLSGVGVLACVAAAAPFLLAMVLASMLPSTDFDTREYHLQGPKEFYQAGRIGFLEHNVYTSFPFLTEMLSLLAMVVRGDWYRGALAGKAVLMCFAPLTALGLYAAGRRLFNAAAGWLAALVYLTTPWTYRTATGFAFAEGGLSFYLFAALFAAAIAIRRLHAGRASLRAFFLCGVMAGSAMACKYTGLVQVVIPIGIAACGSACFAGRGDRSRFKDALWVPAAFAFGILVAVGPWLAKNAVETGNPVYPLAYSIFGGRDWSPELNAKWQHAHTAQDNRGLWYWIVDVIARNDWLSPLLYGLAPLAFLAANWRRRAGWLWLYAVVLFFAWWGLTHRLDRFWVPMIPVVALLAGAGGAWCRHRAWRFVAGAAIAAAVVFNLAVVTSPLAGFNAFLADLEQARLAAEETAPAIALLNRRLPPGSKVLFVGEAQVFDARFPHVYNTVFDESLFERWCAADNSAASSGAAAALAERPLAEASTIRVRFAEAGITHVLVNWKEILRYRTTYGYTPFVTPERFADLQGGGVLGPPVVVQWGSMESLDRRQREDIDGWGQRLKATVGGETAYRAIELFRVLPER